MTGFGKLSSLFALADKDQPLSWGVIEIIVCMKPPPSALSTRDKKGSRADGAREMVCAIHFGTSRQRVNDATWCRNWVTNMDGVFPMGSVAGLDAFVRLFPYGADWLWTWGLEL
jgi:hypothetical protein